MTPPVNSRLQGDSLPTWKKLYENAILELDSSRISSRIFDARRAIVERACELSDPVSSDEYRALNKALHTLNILEEVTVNGNAA
jgi:hypothetical protein